MTAFMDRERAASLMRAQGTDALLLLTPENIYYSAGVTSGLFDLYRHAPMAAALVPADPSEAPAILVNDRDVARAKAASGSSAVFGYSVFMGDGDSAEGLDSPVTTAHDNVVMPEQYDRREIAGLLARMLRERGLERARLGTELDFLDVNSQAILREALPDVQLADAGPLLYDLRAVKCAAEIRALRDACRLTDAGIRAAADAIAPGVAVNAITEAFTSAVYKAACAWDLQGKVGTIYGAPDFAGPGFGARSLSAPGTTVKFDVQVAYNRYFSDIGRTFVLGEATPLQRRVYAVMQEAQARGRDALRPGARICDVFHAATEPIFAAGLARCTAAAIVVTAWGWILR